MKAMNKAGKMAQKFEKSSGGSPRADMSKMMGFGGQPSKGSKKRRKVGSDTEFWR